MTELGWRIADATHRIWAGERDWHALCEGLDRQDSLIVKMVLEALSTDSAADANSGNGLNGLSAEDSAADANSGSGLDGWSAEEAGDEVVGAEEGGKKGVWDSDRNTRIITAHYDLG